VAKTTVIDVERLVMAQRGSFWRITREK